MGDHPIMKFNIFIGKRVVRFDFADPLEMSVIIELLLSFGGVMGIESFSAETSHDNKLIK